ncbi:MAG: hypothetical protein JSV04_13995 [Candidatus Heimdallarchaeota archaeon]|nr:MAG: hypothetical protein JSV04_13995 [Candidatus Heimdallarchaeota archaeon]
MSSTENEYSLSKTEFKLFSSLVMFGGQTKRELLFATNLQAEKAEESLSTLLSKGFIQLDDETEVYFMALPIENMVNLLNASSTEVEVNFKAQTEIHEQHRKYLEEQLNEFRESLEKQLEVFQSSSNMLQASLKDDIETIEQKRAKNTSELAETMLTSFSTQSSEVQTELKSTLSSESANFEDEWTNALSSFQNIPEASIRTVKGSIERYDNELSETIKLAIKKITSIQSKLSDIITAIESESSGRIQEFFTNTDSIAEEFKTNLNTALQESWKQEKEYVNEIRKHVQTTEDEMRKALESVVTNLAKDIDKDLNAAVKEVRLQTEKAIIESSNQLKTEFEEFVENASELVQEQKAPLDVLNTELIEMTFEQKLANFSSTFSRQLQAHLTADLNELESNYRRAQKKTTDIMENVRRSSKDRLIQQKNTFEGLIRSFNKAIQKSIDRKDMDVVRFQQISQSLSQLLGNLLVSVPLRLDHYKDSVKESIDAIITELQENMGESSVNSVQDIYKILTDSQKRIEQSFQETQDECKNEIQSVITSSDQLNNIVSNLQETYAEKIEQRFSQRAKVMNTELEAVARNFQQVINTMDGSFGDVNDRLSAEDVVTNIETSLNNAISHVKKDVGNAFTLSHTKSREFITQLDSTLQRHLDRTLDVIKEGFSQIKAEFSIELEKQLDLINERNDNHQNNLISEIDSFSDQCNNEFTAHKTNLTKTLEENRKTFSEILEESRSATDEVINLHRSNIARYQEKGPNDILTFINQIESEVFAQNKNVKEAMEELVSFYSNFSDSTMGEVTGLLRQYQESGEKLTALVSDSAQLATKNLSKATDTIETYYSDSKRELENQINVSTGFVTSEVESSAEMIRDEVENLKTEFIEILDGLNSEINDLVAHQDQEFKAKLPELSQEFSQVFDGLIQERSNSNQELEEKTEESLTMLSNNFNKQIQNSKETLQDVINTINKAIGSNLENLEVIVEKNVEQTIHSLGVIYNLEDSKEDVFGLREIQSKVKQANKRLKATISESLKMHIEKFDQQLIPELITSHEASHTQTEEDLSRYLEDLGDLILSSQTSLISQIHNFLKEERQTFDFSEMKTELNEIIHNFSKSSTHDIESLSTDLADSIQMTTNEIDKSREKILSLFSEFFAKFVEQNEKLLEDLNKFKEETLITSEKAGSTFKKNIVTSLDTYNNDLEKTSLDLSGKSTQLTQALVENLDTQVSSALEKSQELLNRLLKSYTQNVASLTSLATETSRVKPMGTIRLIKLATDEAKNEFVKDTIRSATKQVSILTANPTFLDVADLKAIPSEKRIYVITNFDFSKKGKKWASEVGKPVNINFHKSKTTKLSGLIVIQDEKVALVLPDTLGFITSDDDLALQLSDLTNFLKGSRIKLSADKK